MSSEICDMLDSTQPVQLQKLERAYSSSQINAHLMFPLFPENRKSIPQGFSNKKHLKNCNPPDL